MKSLLYDPLPLRYYSVTDYFQNMRTSIGRLGEARDTARAKSTPRRSRARGPGGKFVQEGPVYGDDEENGEPEGEDGVEGEDGN
jgi:hypothetical protein